MSIPNTSLSQNYNLSTPDSGLALGSDLAALLANDVDLQSQVDTLDTDTSGKIDETILTTKGDLIVRDASAPARLGIGADGQVATADSAAPTGISWQTPAGTGALESRIAALETGVMPGDRVVADTLGTGAAGWGTTDLNVARFVNFSVTGTAVTYTNLAANGSVFTVAVDGFYSIVAVGQYGQLSDSSLLVTVNSTDLAVNPFDSLVSGVVLASIHNSRSLNEQFATTLSAVMFLNAGDLVRVQGTGNIGGSSSYAIESVWRYRVVLLKDLT